MSRALVISGGGSKGAFAVGIVKRLFNLYPNLTFDIYVGTSTGSLIAPLVAMNEIALLEKIYTTQTTEDVVLQNRLGDRINDTSIFDASPLWQTLTNNYTDQRYNVLLATGKRVFITTTCLQSADTVVFTTATSPVQSQSYEVKTITGADHFRRAIMASACQPIFMQPIQVNKHAPGDPNPDYQFVDGGVREYVGIQMAIDNGATEIFTIILSPEIDTPDNIQFTDLFGILRKTIDIFSDDVGYNDVFIPEQFNKALEYIAAVKTKMKSSGVSDAQVNDFFTIAGMDNPYQNKQPLKLFFFRPDAPLGGGPGGLTFNPVEMAGMLQKGETSADEFIASLDPGEITWA